MILDETGEPWDGEPEELEPEVQQGSMVMHPKQAAFFESDADITVAQAGIRGGKTHVGAFKQIIRAIHDPCELDETHLVGSPTYPMSRVPIDKIFKLLYDKTIFPICPLIRFHRSMRMFLLHAIGGKTTRLSVVSLHDPDRIRGIKAKSAWLDEGAYISREAFDIVQGRLADCNGPMDITTTPAGYNFVHELYSKAIEERNAGIPLESRTHRFIHWASYENTFVKEAGFKRLMAGFDARTYAQEVKALFVKLAGLIYHSFSRAKNIQPGKLKKNELLYVGQDFNVGNMATTIGQKFTNGDKQDGIHFLYERLAPDSGTIELAHFLDRFCSDNGIPKQNVRVVPDASGKARTTAGKSDHQILRDAKFRVEAPARNPPVKDRINCVNGLLSPMFGKYPRLLIDPSCKRIVETMTKQIWKPDSDPPEPDKEHGFDHMGDAVGYPCVKLFPIRLKPSLGNRKAA